MFVPSVLAPVYRPFGVYREKNIPREHKSVHRAGKGQRSNRQPHQGSGGFGWFRHSGPADKLRTQQLSTVGTTETDLQRERTLNLRR